jgi:hypothetical protein
MKIAAIALASALASLAFAQPSWAQQTDQDKLGQMQYGPGHDQFRGDMRRDRDTYGQEENWHRDGDWRGDNEGRRGWHHDEDRMEGRMGMGGMNPHMRGRFAQEQGATFVFGNGRARMAVHCPANESVETCVRAASQLLDKIGSLRGGAGPGSQSGGNTGSGTDDSGRTAHPQLNGGSGALQQQQD